MNRAAIGRKDFLRDLVRWGLLGGLAMLGVAVSRRRSTQVACGRPDQPCATCAERARCPLGRAKFEVKP